MGIVYDAVIIGAGPAGLTAALYTARAGLSTLILEKELIGGELMNRDLIENYPGYSDGVMGPELGSSMANQAMNYGAEIQLTEVKQIEVRDNRKIISTSLGDYEGKGVIVAAGAHPRKMGIPGEQAFGSGVFYCATCDGPRFANKIVAVAGGGDSGITEALLLTKLVTRVILVELQPHLTGTKTLQQRVLSNPKVEIRCGVRIDAIRGDHQVQAIDLTDVRTGEKSAIAVDGVLVRIGLEANTGFLSRSMPLDEKGQIPVNDEMKTEKAGIFAAGDIRSHSPMQIVTAAGDGATAALALCKYFGTR